MHPSINPALFRQDIAVLENLLEEAEQSKAASNGSSAQSKSNGGASSKPNHSEAATIEFLTAVNDPARPEFETTVFNSFDAGDLQKLPPWVHKHVLSPYVRWATTIVRRPTDVVFVTHILLYLAVNLPSAIYLFYDYHALHGVLHFAYTMYCAGPFTLMLHNHIHGGGVLARRWPYSALDWTFPYVLEPLMGHTWDSYYYHHVKHHHAEGNGPEDLSSTLRYQRDSPLHFLCYFGRFALFVWVELPLYFWRKGQRSLALRSALSEQTSYVFLYTMARWRFMPALWSLLLPLALMRLGMMIGNWGQHALVDEEDPASDFRSSITLVDVASNRHCFNDGYHTSHHLHPRRHWRDHALHFVQQKQQYADGRALVFQNIDYLGMTFALLSKNYDKLARCLVPIGEQKGKSIPELAAMLQTKTRRFSEEEIRKRFYEGKARPRPSKR